MMSKASIHSSADFYKDLINDKVIHILCIRRGVNPRRMDTPEQSHLELAHYIDEQNSISSGCGIIIYIYIHQNA